VKPELNPPETLVTSNLPITQVGGMLTGIRVFRSTFDSGLGIGDGLSRLSPPKDYPESRFKVLYMAEDLETALMEAIFRDSLTSQTAFRSLPITTLEDYDISRLAFDFSGWSLLDLTGMGPTIMGMHRDIMNLSDHTWSRQWSAAIYKSVPNIGAVAYHSTFTKRTCIAIYDRAAASGQEISRVPLLSEPVIYKALDNLGVGLFS